MPRCLVPFMVRWTLHPGWLPPRISSMKVEPFGDRKSHLWYTPWLLVWVRLISDTWWQLMNIYYLLAKALSKKPCVEAYFKKLSRFGVSVLCYLSITSFALLIQDCENWFYFQLPHMSSSPSQSFWPTLLATTTWRGAMDCLCQSDISSTTHLTYSSIPSTTRTLLRGSSTISLAVRE